MGAEKYGRLLSSWYAYAGSWAVLVADLSNDNQKVVCDKLMDGFDGVLSKMDRSCIFHSVLKAVFSSFSNIMDAKSFGASIPFDTKLSVSIFVLCTMINQTMILLCTKWLVLHYTRVSRLEWPHVQ